MGVHESIFGSKEERRNYLKLLKTWGDKFNIYHNIPFLSIFTTKDTLNPLYNEDLDIFELNDQEYDFLKKTSIDYVFCDKNDKPILCIDFDGLQKGFNVGREYFVPNTQKQRKLRKINFELKLKVAHGSLFPYFIVGSEQFKGLADSIYLTIVDAIIGEVLSTKASIEKITSGFNPNECGYNEEEFDELDELEKQEIIQDWVFCIEIENDFINNPITKKVSELSKETNSCGIAFSFIEDSSINKDIWIGVKCEVRNLKYGNATSEIFIPNFKTPYCWYSISLFYEIAELLALDQIKKRMKK